MEKVHIKVLPEHYLSRETGGGQSGGNHVRIAMVADMAQCEEDVMYLKKFNPHSIKSLLNRRLFIACSI